MESIQNYYGSLCTEMYELLHENAPREELEFYLSYAKKGQRILEPMCGSGRFFAPFAERGYDISGVDLSGEMLEQLKRKVPGAKAVQADLTQYDPGEKFDYIFIPSGSLSLLTDLAVCKKALRRLREFRWGGGASGGGRDPCLCGGNCWVQMPGRRGLPGHRLGQDQRGAGPPAENQESLRGTVPDAVFPGEL